MVVRARSGEKAALEDLLAWATPRIERLVGSYTGYAEDVGDLVQEVLVEVWNSIRKLKDPSRFSGWLTRIANGKAMDFLRRKYREEQFRKFEEGVSLAELPGPQERDEFLAPIHEEFLAQVRAAIDRLPARFRLVLSLHLLRGLNAPQIARSENLNVNTVKTALRRGLTRLKCAWRRSS